MSYLLYTEGELTTARGAHSVAEILEARTASSAMLMGMYFGEQEVHVMERTPLKESTINYHWD
jgi:hypothetical protein